MTAMLWDSIKRAWRKWRCKHELVVKTYGKVTSMCICTCKECGESWYE